MNLGCRDRKKTENVFPAKRNPVCLFEYKKREYVVQGSFYFQLLLSKSSVLVIFISVTVILLLDSFSFYLTIFFYVFLVSKHQH